MSVDRPTEERRLALTLHKAPAELGYLAALDGAALMKLRTLVQNSLLVRFASLFEKLAASGKLAPDALSALLCRKVFGPSLTANMSYYVPTDRAVRMCKHFEPGFMAEIAREQIPERAQSQLENLPVELMKGVTRELLKSRDYPVMGGFTDYLPEAKALVLMKEIADAADNLRISCFTQRKDRIAKLASALDDARLKEMIAAAFASEEFVQEVSLITAEMPPDQQRRMAKLSDAVDPAHRRQARTMAAGTDVETRLSSYLTA